MDIPANFKYGLRSPYDQKGSTMLGEFAGYLSCMDFFIQYNVEKAFPLFSSVSANVGLAYVGLRL